jgi:RNA polymerase sigma-70 factor (ECF subfamily)
MLKREAFEECDGDKQNGVNRVSDTEGRVRLSPMELAPDAKRYAMSIVRCWADAEEVVQDAFCKLLQSTDSLESGSVEKPLFFRVVHNLCIDRLRAKSRRQLQTLDATEIPTRSNSSLEASLTQLETKIENSLETMPKQWADALKLKLNANLSYQEISSVLEATRAQVRTWIFRARKQLHLDLVKDQLIENEEQQ